MLVTVLHDCVLNQPELPCDFLATTKTSSQLCRPEIKRDFQSTDKEQVLTLNSICLAPHGGVLQVRLGAGQSDVTAGHLISRLALPVILQFHTHLREFLPGFSVLYHSANQYFLNSILSDLLSGCGQSTHVRLAGLIATTAVSSNITPSPETGPNRTVPPARRKSRLNHRN